MMLLSCACLPRAVEAFVRLNSSLISEGRSSYMRLKLKRCCGVTPVVSCAASSPSDAQLSQVAGFF
eukprot:5939234-Alexandrium_andersonii.AAC.1